jgi:hypothetical protein
MPIECFACDENRQNPVGTCSYDDPATYCLNGNYGAAGPQRAFRCLCGDGGANDCPGQTQVCAPSPGGVGDCITCGEIFVTDPTGLACKDGKTCVAAHRACD